MGTASNGIKDNDEVAPEKIGASSKNSVAIAPERFELSSSGPEPDILSAA